MDRTLKIVVADDERETREFLQEFLSLWGHEIRVVEDGRQLVKMCSEFVPDLIVTDYTMPVMDGWSAVREVNRHHPIPVILFSGRDDVEALVLGENSPVIRVLTKPVKDKDLKDAVETAKAALMAGANERPT